jgi:hypothetical protein
MNDASLMRLLPSRIPGTPPLWLACHTRKTRRVPQAAGDFAAAPTTPCTPVSRPMMPKPASATTPPRMAHRRCKTGRRSHRPRNIQIPPHSESLPRAHSMPTSAAAPDAYKNPTCGSSHPAESRDQPAPTRSPIAHSPMPALIRFAQFCTRPAPSFDNLTPTPRCSPPIAPPTPLLQYSRAIASCSYSTRPYLSACEWP